MRTPFPVAPTLNAFDADAALTVRYIRCESYPAHALSILSETPLPPASMGVHLTYWTLVGHRGEPQFEKYLIN